MAIIGKRLKEAREKAGFTQMKAAEILGISNGTLSGYERNYRDPDTDIMDSMADLFGVSVEWLMGRTNNPNSLGPVRPDFEITDNISDRPRILHGPSLTYIRQKFGLSFLEVSKKTGISLDDLERYEKGEVPTTEHEKALQVFFNNEEKKKDKEDIDILNDLERIIDGLDGGYAAYDGSTPEEKEDFELLKASLETSMRLAKRLAKEKFTPNKYKDK